MIKNWLKSPNGIRCVTALTSLVLRLLLASIRWQRLDHSNGIIANAEAKPVIFINWHCRLLSMPAMLKNIPTAYIISPSQDGQLISGTVKPLGVDTIWGSRSKKAISGYRDMRRRLAQGLHVGITPDGPRGPARKAAPGAILLAKASGIPLIPVAWSSDRIWRLNSWDRLAIPKPFSRGIQIFGAPIYIAPDASAEDIEKAIISLEDAVNAITAEADAVFGHPADHAEHRYGIVKDKKNKPEKDTATDQATDRPDQPS